MAAISKTAANISPLLGAITRPVTFGEAIDLGEAVYFESDGDVNLADADVAASAQVRGIVVSCPDGRTSGVAGDKGDIVLYGPVTGFSGMTPGGPVYASITAGAMDQTAPAGASGDFKWHVGFALDANTIFVCPFTDDVAAQ